MDPVTVLTTTLGLFSAIPQLKGLVEKYRSAPKQVGDTLQQCNDMETKLNLVREFIQNNQDALAQSENREQLMALLTSSTKGITSTLRRIRKEVPKIDAKNNQKAQSKLGRWEGVNHGFANLERRLPTYAEIAKKPGSTPIELETAPRAEPQSSTTGGQNDFLQKPNMSKTEKKLIRSLHTALIGKHSGDITALLRQGANIDSRLNSMGDRAIHIAARNGDMDSVRTLQRHAADMKPHNEQGCTPLMVALHNAHVDVSSFILENSPYAPDRDITGKLALHYAAEASLLEPMMRLIKLGAEVDSTDTQGRTPLHYALQPKAGGINQQVICFLVDAGASPTVLSTTGVTPLHLAAEAANQEEALSLLISKADSLEVGAPNTPLVQAASCGRTAPIQILLDAGAMIDPVQDGISALAAAFEGKHIESFSMLLNKGANPNMRSPSDLQGRYLLHLAATEVTPFGARALDYLVQQPTIKINLLDAKQESPIFQAVSAPCIPAVALLLQHGADPLTKSTLSMSARRVAAENGRIRVLQLLYANVSNRTTEWMYFPFVFSILKSQLQSAACFLGLGFDINKSRSGGIPPLHYIAHHGNLPGVKWLMGEGADKSVRANSTGEQKHFKTPGPIGTAEDVARSFGHTEVADYLASFVDCPHIELFRREYL
ncbi:hypothetical protein PG988_000251 [Apiospora saccharicola]